MIRNSGPRKWYFAPFGFASEIKTLLWNVEGLKSLLNAPEASLLDKDLLVLTETFLLDPVYIKGYYGIHSLAEARPEGRPSGGVSCFYKPIMGQPVKVQVEVNSVVIVFSTLAVIAMYVNPTATAETLVGAILQALQHMSSGTPVILAGDFNCRRDKPDRKAIAVFDMLEEEGFKLVNKESIPTYICHNGSSVIDLVFYRGKEINITHQKHIWTPIRKHVPIQTCFTIEALELEKKEQEWAPRRINTDQLSSLIERETITSLIEKGDINEALDRIETTLLDSSGEKPTERRSKPWFDSECFTYRKKTLEKLHRWRMLKSEAALVEYSEKRRNYKALIREKRLLHAQKVEFETLRAAEISPHKILEPRRAKVNSQIPMTSWEDHFTKLYQKTQITKGLTQEAEETAIVPIAAEEVWFAIMQCKPRKAPGPDRLTNEVLKDSLPVIIDVWTAFFNACIKLKKIPDRWRESTIQVIYKGKGPKDSPDGYRGVALECAIFKIFTKIILNRIFPQATEHIPEEQYGFMPGRSTTQAIAKILAIIWGATESTGGHMYAAFIDYAKAFDGVNRTILLKKVANILGDGNPLVLLLENILSFNWLRVNDKVGFSRPITQTNGVLQGDPLSPMLFNLLTHDVIREVAGEQITMLLYADDMVMLTRSKQALQEGLTKLHKWSHKNDLEINAGKTKIMKFRRGGNISKSDNFTCGSEKLDLVNAYKYLGLTLQVTGKAFTKHIEERCTAATKAIFDIKKLEKISLRTALRLFHIKIAPIASYAIAEIWLHLSLANLRRLDSVKVAYLRRALRLPRTAPSRLVYLLANSDFFVRELAENANLAHTPAYEALIREREEKAEAVEPEFHDTPAMNTNDWKESNYELRHIYTRTAIHGFHYRICAQRGYHQPAIQCACTQCGKRCKRYHLLVCPKRTKSMAFYANDNNFQ